MLPQSPNASIASALEVRRFGGKNCGEAGRGDSRRGAAVAACRNCRCRLAVAATAAVAAAATVAAAVSHVELLAAAPQRLRLHWSAQRRGPCLAQRASSLTPPRAPAAFHAAVRARARARAPPRSPLAMLKRRRGPRDTVTVLNFVLSRDHFSLVSRPESPASESCKRGRRHEEVW